MRSMYSFRIRLKRVFKYLFSIKKVTGLLFAFNLFFNINAQPIPTELDEYDLFEFIYDFGYNWDQITTFQPVSWQNFYTLIQNKEYKEKTLIKSFKESYYAQAPGHLSKYPSDSLYIDIKLGSVLNQYFINRPNKNNSSNSTIMYSYSMSSYKRYFKSWLYPRITNRANQLSHFSGIPRKRSRLGFNSGEVDMSGIGYFGEWVQIWTGRGRQNWGSHISNNLAISNNSVAYDQTTMQMNFRKLRFRYFHGYLETIENNINRFITGRGLEYFNSKNLLVAFHEISIYSGENRNLDFSYLNPISTHLEIELNERDNNYGGTGGQNSVWQLSLDYMPKNKLRFSSNILIDELALDNIESDTITSKNDFAISNRISYSFFMANCFITIFTNYVYVSTHAFRHEQGGNNFVSRSLPLGTNIGSDGDCIEIGTKFVLPWKFIGNLSIGSKKNGNNSIEINPYQKNILNNDPRIVKKDNFFLLSARYNYSKNTNIKFGFEIINSNKDRLERNYYFSLNSYLPVLFVL